MQFKSSSNVCPCCKLKSPTVFAVGWTCLQPSCVLFWRKVAATFSLESQEYDSNFLQLRREPVFAKLDLTPEAPVTEPSDDSTSERQTSGWWCESCGLLNCRYDVVDCDGWLLTNPCLASGGSAGIARIAKCVGLIV